MLELNNVNKSDVNTGGGLGECAFVKRQYQANSVNVIGRKISIRYC